MALDGTERGIPDELPRRCIAYSSYAGLKVSYRRIIHSVKRAYRRVEMRVHHPVRSKITRNFAFLL
jgi:hypothetical protein